MRKIRETKEGEIRLLCFSPGYHHELLDRPLLLFHQPRGRKKTHENSNDQQSQGKGIARHRKFGHFNK